MIVATGTPGELIPDVNTSGLDKVVHFGMHFIFAWLVHRSLLYQANTHRSKQWSLALTFLGVSVFGIIVEWYQLYIPGRSADVMDGIMNIGGAAIYCLAYLLIISRFWPKKA